MHELHDVHEFPLLKHIKLKLTFRAWLEKHAYHAHHARSGMLRLLGRAGPVLALTITNCLAKLLDLSSVLYENLAEIIANAAATDGGESDAIGIGQIEHIGFPDRRDDRGLEVHGHIHSAFPVCCSL